MEILSFSFKKKGDFGGVNLFSDSLRYNVGQPS